MRWKYEKTCRDMGLDMTEKTKIQRIFDREKQQRSRQKKNAEEYQ